MARKVTIADIAKCVGVSKSTVSYAISGKRSISGDMRHKIFQAIEKMGFKPDFFASCVKNGSSKMIVIVIGGLSNRADEYFKIISDKFYNLGYDIIIGVGGDDLARGRAILRNFSSGIVDGVINLLPYIDSSEAIILCGDVPVFTRQRDDYAPLKIDYDNMTKDIIKYLSDRGHSKIAYISSPTRSYYEDDTSIKLFNEYNQNSKTKDLIEVGNDDKKSGYMAIAKIFEKAKPSAVVVANDQMALGVYKWAYDNNIAIPKELSVIGYNNIPQSEMLNPPLTTFQHPLNILATHDCNGIIGKIKGLPPRELEFLQVEMVERESVADLR